MVLVLFRRVRSMYVQEGIEKHQCEGEDRKLMNEWR